MKISVKYLTSLFLVTTVLTFFALAFLLLSHFSELTYIASLSMGAGVALSFYCLRNTISPSSSHFINLVNILILFLVSHFIAGILCGIGLTLLKSYQFSAYEFAEGIFSAMIYSFVVSPVTIMVITVGTFVLNRKSRGTYASYV
jgi:hypothetical protein